jgi:putative N6-adenine-specific DNA methylase/tRNA (guanine6-N2)-methyltransferase
MYLLITDPGLEQIAAEEVAERLPGAAAEIKPYALPGHVRVEASAIEPLLELRTIHHVIELRGESEIERPDDVAGALADVEFPELENAASFRVTSKLRGDHPLGKQELQRAAGAALFGRHRTPVDLENFELNIRVDLYGNRLVAGIQRTTDSLGNRIKRARPLRSALKPTIAAAMLRLAGAHKSKGRLIDPMCGSGTIPIEAARINPRLDIQANDWDEQTVEVARETVAGHGLDIDFHVADARALGEMHPRSFDFIVTNPPYGVRQAKRTSIARLYRSLLPSFAAAIKRSGRIVLIVVKYRAFLAALESADLHIENELIVDLGGIDARIYGVRSSLDAGETSPNVQ